MNSCLYTSKEESIPALENVTSCINIRYHPQQVTISFQFLSKFFLLLPQGDCKAVVRLLEYKLLADSQVRESLWNSTVKSWQEHWSLFLGPFQEGKHTTETAAETVNVRLLINSVTKSISKLLLIVIAITKMKAKGNFLEHSPFLCSTRPQIFSSQVSWI